MSCSIKCATDWSSQIQAPLNFLRSEICSDRRRRALSSLLFPPLPVLSSKVVGLQFKVYLQWIYQSPPNCFSVFQSTVGFELLYTLLQMKSIPSEEIQSCFMIHFSPWPNCWVMTSHLQLFNVTLSPYFPLLLLPGFPLVHQRDELVVGKALRDNPALRWVLSGEVVVPLSLFDLPFPAWNLCFEGWGEDDQGSSILSGAVSMVEPLSQKWGLGGRSRPWILICTHLELSFGNQ